MQSNFFLNGRPNWSKTGGGGFSSILQTWWWMWANSISALGASSLTMTGLRSSLSLFTIGGGQSLPSFSRHSSICLSNDWINEISISSFEGLGVRAFLTLTQFHIFNKSNWNKTNRSTWKPQMLNRPLDMSRVSSRRPLLRQLFGKK